MSRGRHPRRIRLSPPDPETAAKYLLYWKGRELHFRPDLFPKIDSLPLFDNHNPLELEVGCGVAEFLCERASQEPDINFVGVDIFMKGLYMATDIANSMELSNIKFIKADFKQLYPLLVPDSLQILYLHFPDPNIKKKYRKRRMMDSVFLDNIYRALSPQGKLSVMTDEPDFFMDMLAMIEQDTRYEKHHKARYLIGFDESIKSRYQRIWEERGRTTHRFEVGKRVQPISEPALMPEISVSSPLNSPKD